MADQQAQTIGTKITNAAGATKDVLLTLKTKTPALIPTAIGVASLLALFIGFVMQFYLIGHGRSVQQKVDNVMKNTTITIIGVAFLSVFGVILYYIFNTVKEPYFWLFMLVMVQMFLLHIAISTSLYQVEIITK